VSFRIVVTGETHDRSLSIVRRHPATTFANDGRHRVWFSGISLRGAAL
jgi:hypothetical protein